MSFSRTMLEDLAAGAVLHDIGKMKIPKNILNKTSRLTEEEFEIMKKHSLLGYDLVKDLSYVSDRAKKIVLQHHERVDGSGYPYSLDGTKISRFAKITALSDVYDAVVSDRVYRKGISGSEAYEFILGGAGTLFDWELVNLFKNNFSIYPLGACVRLTNSVEGFVVRENKGFPDRPIIRVTYDKNGRAIEPIEIDLLEKIDICIDKVLI
jgi:HD-GYP domain-containing protein (c-di-GMP phosphodiesterase class II)